MLKTMKRIGVWTVFFSFSLIQFAFSDQLVTSGDYAFLADWDLKIYNIVDPKETDPEIIPIGNATAVAISGNNAVVTIDNEDETFSIQIVDISEYVDGGPNPTDCEENKYLGSFDIDEGVITLPGVELNDTIFTLVMERRGNSNNWQITFVEEADGEDEEDEEEEDEDEDEDEDDGK